MAKKLHPTELRDIERAAQAQSYNVHFRKGPDETFNVKADTMDEAREAAASLNALHGQYGRRAAIYGLLPDGSSVMVP